MPLISEAFFTIAVGGLKKAQVKIPELFELFLRGTHHNSNRFSVSYIHLIFGCDVF